MAIKLFKISNDPIRNCKIHPILYHFFLRLKETLEAEIVHRRKRTSDRSIEIIYKNHFGAAPTGRLNTLKEAEKWGFWIVCRLQTKNHTPVFYHDRLVYQLFLTPVHPKKRREHQPIIHSLTTTSRAISNQGISPTGTNEAFGSSSSSKSRPLRTCFGL